MPCTAGEAVRLLSRPPSSGAAAHGARPRTWSASHSTYSRRYCSSSRSNTSFDAHPSAEDGGRVSGAPFLSRATSRYLTSRKEVPPLIRRPANLAPSLAVLHRWLRGGLDEELMNKYLRIVCNRHHTSGYFTRGSVCSYLRSTTDAITSEEYRDLFQPSRGRRRPACVNFDLLLKHFLAHGVAESTVDDVILKLRATYTRTPTLMSDANYWYAAFKGTLIPLWTDVSSHEHPRHRRAAWGVLRKLIALMKYHKRWTTSTVTSRMYAAELSAGGWRIYILMNARFTVAILGRRS